MTGPDRRTKSERRADRERVGAYHSAQLAKLLEHVRAGFNAYDAGRINAFELDDIIHHYERVARKLDNFCGHSGGQWERAARHIEWFEAEGQDPDWWAEA